MISCRPTIVLLMTFLASTVLGDQMQESEKYKHTIKNASYAYAYEMAPQLFNEGNTGISTNDFLLGLKDYLEGTPPKFNKQERTDLVQYYHSRQSNIYSEQLRKKPEQNQVSTNEHLRYVAKQPGVVSDQTGLQYRIIQEGRGPLPEDDDVILFEYKIASGNGQISTFEKKTCYYKCGSMQEGWMAFLKRMREGAEYVIYVPELEAKNFTDRDSPEVAAYTVKILAIKPYQKIEY